MKNVDELFEGDFSESEKAVVAQKVMEVQDRVRHSGRTEIAAAVLYCVLMIILAVGFYINIDKFGETERNSQKVAAHHLTGKAGDVQDIVSIILLPLISCMPIAMALGTAASAEKENRRYREFTARKFTVVKVAEHESVKGLYTVTASCNGKQICFDTSDKAAKDYDKGSVMTVVEFLGVNENAPEKNYDYYSASDEQRRVMAFRKLQKYKYVIIHI